MIEFYKKVCVIHSDLSIFVLSCAWMLIDPGQPEAVIRKTNATPHGSLMIWEVLGNNMASPGPLFG
ncbi:MAG: hypothetical protein CSA29_04865 [Desulfobacterales bacterium]|nr:MAG: hypothetical protein CSA29_04865 [Desulfobacterales bacterium]